LGVGGEVDLCDIIGDDDFGVEIEVG